MTEQEVTAVEVPEEAVADAPEDAEEVAENSDNSE